MSSDFKPPSGPPPSYRANRVALASNNPYRNAHQDPENEYVQISHVKAEKNGGEYSSHQPTASTEYQPPAGPPPSHQKSTASTEYQPPPGPPPSHHIDDVEPPPYDPWLAVPDNALLPPPPALKDQFSPANNASMIDADRARDWCQRNPLAPPRAWDGRAVEQIKAHYYTLSAPPGSRGIEIAFPASHRTSLKSSKRQEDTTVLSNLPLLAPLSLPLAPGQVRTIYFEFVIKYMSGPDASVAIGFVAPPYPPNRLPGWHRGSLAVHNDDGHRFVNDDEGGVEFVRPFGPRDRVGFGITYTGSRYAGQPADATVFFTRNGHRENSWDLHESRDIDAQDGGIAGLDATNDLYAAVGVCGGVELEVDWATEIPQ